jgi:hypothetical protein
MVCGCFAGDTVSDLCRIQGSLNQHDYHSILQRYAIPSGLVGLSFVFQMTWPPQSPDLHPIEMVLSICGNSFQIVWKSIPGEAG